jgi:hypothetical protein
MNRKNERIRKLWNRGVRDPKKIAKKLGLASEERVLEGLAQLQAKFEITGYVKEGENGSNS